MQKKSPSKKRNRRLPNYVSEYVIKLAQRTELQPSGSLAIDLAHSERTKLCRFFALRATDQWLNFFSDYSGLMKIIFVVYVKNCVYYLEPVT